MIFAKNKPLILLFLAMVMILSLALGAIAQTSQNQNMNQGQNQIMGQGQNTSTITSQGQNQEQEQEQAQKQEQQQIINQEHKSAVANFVQNLLEVAEREAGIGAQVKIIAQQQNQSASTTIQAIEQIQVRNKIKTLLFGSDYKNLGTLRSEMIQTGNRLGQLTHLMENVQNQGDKTELQNQIQTLKQEQVKIENFIKTQENQFSLFGWLIKLFNR